MSQAPRVSFEFFPPGDTAMAEQLWEAVQRLAPLDPDFVSVTYGADGSTRARTHECVLRIRRETHLVVAPHLTCVGATCAEVLDIAASYWREGIRHLVALRGDPPAPGGAVTSAASGAEKGDAAQPSATATGAADGGYAHAADLVAGLKGFAEFELSVAAYPEGHPETRTVEADIENLKRKLDAGATRAITQFFFETDLFLRYRDRCAAAGLAVQLVPGILPITRMPQLLRFAARCGADVPNWLRARFDGLEEDLVTRRLIAAHVAIEQCERLRDHGVEEFHFYTLNRADLTYAICHALGLRPRAAEARTTASRVA
jgi:methylenetetrahydrofolate reductase (NADPH)